MKKYLVYLADIHGKDIKIEKELLGDIPVVKMDERTSRTRDAHRIIRNGKHADGIGVRHTRVTADIIDKLQKCRIIARFGGGYDNIDIGAATSRGIIVTFVPDYCSDAVSEHALTLALMKIRGIKEFQKRVRRRFWSAQGVRADMAKDVTLGIIGLGRIGGALSKKASLVGFKVIAYDPFITIADFEEKGARRMRRLSDLLKNSDIISLNVPLTREGKHPTFRMLGRKEFRLMKKGASIINVCRGEVMDTSALISALRTHKISDVAIDVIEGEPRQNSYLRSGSNPTFDTLGKMPNVTITPHCAFTSTRSVRDVKRKGVMEIRSVLKGRFPRKIAWVNPEVKENYLKRFRIRS